MEEFENFKTDRISTISDNLTDSSLKTCSARIIEATRDQDSLMVLRHWFRCWRRFPRLESSTEQKTQKFPLKATCALEIRFRSSSQLDDDTIACEISHVSLSG